MGPKAEMVLQSEIAEVNAVSREAKKSYGWQEIQSYVNSGTDGMHLDGLYDNSQYKGWARIDKLWYISTIFSGVGGGVKGVRYQPFHLL